MRNSLTKVFLPLFLLFSSHVSCHPCILSDPTANSTTTPKPSSTSPSGTTPATSPATRTTTLYTSPSSTTVKSTRDAPGSGTTEGHSKKVICYYGSWAVYRPDSGKYPVEEIDPFICTHLIYTFAGLGWDNRIRSLDPWNDLKDNYGKGAFERFTGLKNVNPKLKTLLAIGGWNEGSIKYSGMASSPESRRVFVESAVEFLEKYNFDGLDLDWEYPAARGGKLEDKANFASLVRELKTAFEPKGFLLTAAVSAGKWFVDPAYDVPTISRYLDFINIMCYDYHGGWEDKTGHNAPMYARPEEEGNDRISNVNFSINYWISEGAPPQKLMLGMGSYGRSFTLAKSEVNGYGAPAPQKGQAGPYTREPGSLGYNEICEMQSKEKWTIVRNSDVMAPYAYRDRQWVGYDDMESIEVKTRYANAMGLGGGMIWSIETDDYRGSCHGLKYPLIKTINRVFAEVSPQVPTPPPSAVTPETPEREDEPLPPSSSTPTPSGSSSTESWQTPWRPQSSSSSTTPEWEKATSSSTTESSSTSKTWWTSWASSSTTTTTPSPASTSTTEYPKWTPEPSSLPCREAGMYRNPKDCRKFYRCVDTGVDGRYRIYEYTCPSETVFDDITRLCMWPENVPECSRYYMKDAPGNNEVEREARRINP